MSHLSPGPIAAKVSAKDMQRAVADLHKMTPYPGLLKVCLYSVGLAACFWVAATHQAWSAPFLLACFVMGWVFGFFIILTHDAIHHTLTGWAWFDELLPRVLSYPFYWCHGCYSEIHLVHHRMNGWDLDDPERVQPTEAEYEAAGAFKRWTYRHQFLWNILVLGGAGMIIGLFLDSLKRSRHSRALRRALIQDTLGILGCNVVIYYLAYNQGFLGRWLLGYLIVERVTGAIQQFRSTLEHYDVWGKRGHYFETQAMGSRNVSTQAWVSWLFNGLNYHSVHHAFPKVPFFSLKAAHKRLEALFLNAGQPLPQSPSYLGGLWEFTKRYRLIPEQAKKSS